MEASTAGLAYSQDRDGPTAASAYPELAAGAVTQMAGIATQMAPVNAADAEAYSDALAYSDEVEVPEPEAFYEDESRKPFLLVGSALTSIFVVGVVALVISLAVSIRPTVDQRPSPGETPVIPSQAAPGPGAGVGTLPCLRPLRLPPLRRRKSSRRPCRSSSRRPRRRRGRSSSRSPHPQPHSRPRLRPRRRRPCLPHRCLCPRPPWCLRFWRRRSTTRRCTTRSRRSTSRSGPGVGAAVAEAVAAVAVAAAAADPRRSAARQPQYPGSAVTPGRVRVATPARARWLPGLGGGYPGSAPGAPAPVTTATGGSRPRGGSGGGPSICVLGFCTGGH